jgi:hypothetical protein
MLDWQFESSDHSITTRVGFAVLAANHCCLCTYHITIAPLATMDEAVVEHISTHKIDGFAVDYDERNSYLNLQRSLDFYVEDDPDNHRDVINQLPVISRKLIHQERIRRVLTQSERRALKDEEERTDDPEHFDEDGRYLYNDGEEEYGDDWDNETTRGLPVEKTMFSINASTALLTYIAEKRFRAYLRRPMEETVALAWKSLYVDEDVAEVDEDADDGMYLRKKEELLLRAFPGSWGRGVWCDDENSESSDEVETVDDDEYAGDKGLLRLVNTIMVHSAGLEGVPLAGALRPASGVELLVMNPQNQKSSIAFCRKRMRLMRLELCAFMAERIELNDAADTVIME